ncbi:MAG: dephospho-CoA kinase [Flavobacteriaceae bacterium]|jgi:dephospho-CoA kinase|nr:dephospho-CoA kinase [Flavobacteriaceae bacterium]
MKVVGLTGGMGTGKSTVAKLFEEKGYPVYSSDSRAKELMMEDKDLKAKLIHLLGEDSYSGDTLNKKYIAQKIFSDKKLLQEQNALVHSAVRNDFKDWVAKQKGDFCIKEAAILFESGAHKDCDYIIVVTAPEQIRINRILSRDGLTEEEIKKRLQNQWSQEKLADLADFQITNDSDMENIKTQVNHIIKQLEERIKTA